VSELKSVSGSNKLPYGTLALGSEGIKDAITGFEDAYVSILDLSNLQLTILFLKGGNRILRTSVSHPTSSMQKKARHTPNLKHPQKPTVFAPHPQVLPCHLQASPSHLQALPQVWNLPSRAARSHPRLLRPLLHPLLLEVCRSSVAMAGRLVWARQGRAQARVDEVSRLPSL
jgi:hypothetical protein